MSDETKNDLPIESVQKTKSVINAASDLLQDQAIPDPVKRGIWIVLKRFGTAALEVPTEWFERGIAERRAESEERIKFARAVNQQLIQQIKTDPEFTERASNMFAQRILRERFNLEKTFGFVVDIFKKKYNNSKNQQTNSQTEETISEDWFNVYEKEASQKSTEDMQIRFAKVLAGEIEKPGSHSIKAVKALGDMDQTIANLFQKLCSMSIVIEHPIGEKNIEVRVVAIDGKAAQNALQKYGLSFYELNILNEYGLIFSNFDTLSDYHVSILPIRRNQVFIPFRHQEQYWGLRPSAEREQRMNSKLSGVVMSNVGQELFHTVEQIPILQYTQDLKQHFKKRQLEMVEVSKEKKGQNIEWRII